jgi:ubiquinone/menaquinone biosynthesis C-methylase UbiE
MVVFRELNIASHDESYVTLFNEFIYGRILPHLIHFAMRGRNLAAHRARVVSRAKGRGLEIGIGSGLNLLFYATAVDELVGLEPSARLADMARSVAVGSRLPVALLKGRAERIPLDDHLIDTAVTTWTLCSISDVALALAEIRRVLKRGGQLLFVEHGVGPRGANKQVATSADAVVEAGQRRSHLDRPIDRLIRDAGFGIETLNTEYMAGPKVATFIYEGIARPR